MTTLKDMIAVSYSPYGDGGKIEVYAPIKSLIPSDKAYDLTVYEGEDDEEGKLKEGYTLVHTECSDEYVMPEADIYIEVAEHDGLEGGWGQACPGGGMASSPAPEFEFEGILLVKYCC